MSAQSVPALIEAIIRAARAERPGRPAIVGLAGPQGAGKTTFCARFLADTSWRVAHFSLDDVYLTKAERTHMAKAVHPLFATRGPPGTHDLDLAKRTITMLTSARPNDRTPLPRFDKSSDERIPESEWPVFVGRPDAILVDGWCLGANVPTGMAVEPLNPLEEEEDPHRIWRNHMLAPLATRYPLFFALFDLFIYLRGPNFDVVRHWRFEQEEELLGRRLADDEAENMHRFIDHFERITRAMIDGQHRARFIVQMDAFRRILAVEQRA